MISSLPRQSQLWLTPLLCHNYCITKRRLLIKVDNQNKTCLMARLEIRETTLHVMAKMKLRERATHANQGRQVLNDTQFEDKNIIYESKNIYLRVRLHVGRSTDLYRSNFFVWTGMQKLRIDAIKIKNTTIFSLVLSAIYS